MVGARAGEQFRERTCGWRWRAVRRCWPLDRSYFLRRGYELGYLLLGPFGSPKEWFLARHIEPAHGCIISVMG